MRLSANARSLRDPDQRAARQSLPPSTREVDAKHLSQLLDDTALATLVDCSPVHARQLVEELSHELRQPLTSMRMNLQSAVRLLQSPTPAVAPALDALVDCMSVENDVIRLLTYARQRFAALSDPSIPLQLNELVRDVITSVSQTSPTWASLVESRLTDPSPIVASESLRLRFALLTLARRALLSAETECGWVNTLLFETRRDSSRAELRLSGLCPHCLAGASMQSLVGLIQTRGRHFDGITTIDVRETGGTVIISLPHAVHGVNSIDGGKHGD